MTQTQTAIAQDLTGGRTQIQQAGTTHAINNTIILINIEL